MIWQRYLAGAAILAFNAMMLYLALGLPPVRSRGDVGGAFLPLIVSVCGSILALLYLLSVWRGRDDSTGSVEGRAVAFLALFLIVGFAMELVGLAPALAVAAGVGVLMIDRQRVWVRALMTAAVVWALAQGGFGWLLGLPLP
jgi:hypothetical protein